MNKTKICSKCSIGKPVTEFEKDRRNPTGYGTRCRDCVRAYLSKWRTDNREHFNNYYRKYYADHPLTHLERTARWYSKNKDKVRAAGRRRYASDPEQARNKRRALYQKYPEREREKSKKYRKSNPIKRRAAEAVRRTRKNNSVGRYTEKDVLKMLEQQDNKCRYCGDSIVNKYEVDHIVPLSRGGSNDLSNLVIACQPCNGSKHNKLISEWRPDLLMAPGVE